MAQRDLLPDPNWDDFEPGGEELDYEEENVPENDEEVDVQGHEEVFEAYPSSSSPFAIEEPQQPGSSRSGAQPVVNLPVVGDVPLENRARHIGPSLPPGFALMNNDDSAPEDPSDDPEDPGILQRFQNVGPQLPSLEGVGEVPHHVADEPGPSHRAVVIGPALPPELNPPARDVAEPRVLNVGPSLPDEEIRFRRHDGSNGFGSGPPPEPSGTRRILGPAMPPDLLPNGDGDEAEAAGEAMEPEPDIDLYGPAPPPPVDQAGPPDVPGIAEEDDDGEMIGPMPPGPSGVDEDRAAEEYALRRLALEQEREAAQNVTQREEWMVQLPKKLTNYGLGARTFSKSSAKVERDDSWTANPNQRRDDAQPSTSGQSNDSIQAAALRARDEEQERVARELNDNRQESLLDSHARKRKADVQQNGSTPSGSRRAFDRERDMEVRGLKGSSTEEIKKKCGHLSNRFGSSEQQKFL